MALTLRHRANISTALKGHLVSLETRARISIAKKGRPLTPECRAALKGRVFTPEHRAHLSAKNMGRPVSLETRGRISIALRGRRLTVGHRFTPEQRAKISTATKGRVFSASHRAKLIDAFLNTDRPWGGKRIEYLDARGRVHRMRSSYEVRYAQHLDQLGADWDYEPDRLLLSTGTIYIPDFRIGRRYVEIKGWAGWTKSIKKAEQAKADGYDVELIVGHAALIAVTSKECD